MSPMKTLAAAAVLALGSTALATPVEFDFSSNQSARGNGSFTGTAIYDDTTHTFTLDVTNTSTHKGVLNALAFDVPAGDIAKFDKPSGSHWKDLRNHKGFVNAKAYGHYDAGVGVHAFSGMGAKSGLASGQSEDFTFNVTGPNVSNLTTADFFTGTRPQVVAGFAGFRKAHYRRDHASGFGTLHTTTTTTTTPGTTTNNPPGDTPILNLEPPPIKGGPITSPVGPPAAGPPVAVPLPAAAPAGLAMLGAFGIFGIVRRIRAKIA